MRIKTIPSFFLVILIIISSSFTRPFTALEKMNLCQSVSHISKALEEQKLQSLIGEGSTKDGIVIYDSKIDVEGLEDEFIADSETEMVFFATYTTASPSKLKAKFEEMKKQIGKCLDKEFETVRLDEIETASFLYSEKITVEVTIYYEDNEIDLNVEFPKGK